MMLEVIADFFQRGKARAAGAVEHSEADLVPPPVTPPIEEAPSHLVQACFWPPVTLAERAILCWRHQEASGKK